MVNSEDPGAAQLITLADLISDAVRTVVAEYAAADQRIPLLDSIAPGPFDAPETVSPNLTKAVKTIEAACKQLACAVASPAHTVVNVCRQLQTWLQL
jgi:hypothetical protein